MTNFEALKNCNIYDKNLLFIGDDNGKVKRYVKEYISLLNQRNNKVFLLDSFWSSRKYKRYRSSRYLKEIERRYHIKLSADDFLAKDNVFNYMNERNIKIMKVKSITGFMSAAELFPVILSKINQDIGENKAYILINDFVLEHLNEGEFLDIYMGINKERIKFFVFHNREKLPEGLSAIIDEVVRVK